MKKLILFTFLAIGMAFTYSCEKEKCKDCYLIEAEGTPDEIILSIGEKCGDELDDIDGKTYQGSQVPARSYCE